MKKDVYAQLNLGWGSNGVMLPLKDAHEIQAILARSAVGIGYVYRTDAKDVHYIEDYEVPDVKVVAMPDTSLQGMDNKTKQAWMEMVRQCETETFLSPQEWLALTGDSNE